MNEYVSDIDVGGLLRRVIHEPNPAIAVLESREYATLIGTQVAVSVSASNAPITADASYVYTAEQAPSGKLIRSLYALPLVEDDKTGRPRAAYTGPWYFGPAALRVVSGAVEIGIADTRAPTDKLASAPTFVSRGLLRAGATLEVVSPHTWVMIKPHLDSILDIVFGVPQPEPKGRKLPVRKFDRLVNTLKRG